MLDLKCDAQIRLLELFFISRASINDLHVYLSLVLTKHASQFGFTFLSSMNLGQFIFLAFILIKLCHAQMRLS